MLDTVTFPASFQGENDTTFKKSIYLWDPFLINQHPLSSLCVSYVVSIGRPLQGTLLKPTFGSLNLDLLLRGSISPRLPLILTPTLGFKRVLGGPGDLVSR